MRPFDSVDARPPARLPLHVYLGWVCVLCIVYVFAILLVLWLAAHVGLG